jgi:uncharacterized membrane protein (UPF0127 family)
MRYVSVVNTSTGEVLAERAAVAETFLARFLGLQWRRSLPKGTGLVLLPNNSVHMFFMFMCLDVVFVGADGIVQRVVRRLCPWSVGPIVPSALYCVELPPGAASLTQAGHAIDLRAV